MDRIILASSSSNWIIEKDGILYRRVPGTIDQPIPNSLDPIPKNHFLDCAVAFGMKPVASSNGGEAEIPDSRGGVIWCPQTGLWTVVKRLDWIKERLSVDPEIMDYDEAQSEIACYISCIPDHWLDASKISQLEVFESDRQVQNRARELGCPDTVGLRGMFDENTGIAIVSLVVNEDGGRSGKIFYHEFAHSIEHLFSQEEIARVYVEWPAFKENHFAYAFGYYMVAVQRDTLEVFCNIYPATCAVLEKHRLKNN